METKWLRASFRISGPIQMVTSMLKGFNAHKTFSNLETRTGVELFPAKIILAANELRLFLKRSIY